MTIRITSTASSLVAGYALGSTVSTFTAAQEAAAVAAGAAEYASAQPEDPTGAVEPGVRTLVQTGIPCIIVPNGTVATNGTLTVGTALPLTYPRAWVYLPAGAVVGGLVGWYYCVFSSTTVGQVYASYIATMTKPHIPAVLTAAVGSNSSYTQATSTTIQMGGFKLPAGVLGSFGAVDYKALFAYNSTAGAKVSGLSFGGSAVVTSSATTTTGITIGKTVQNRATNSQVIQASLETGATVSVAPTLLAIDTTADVTAGFTGNIAVATDYIVLETARITIYPAE